MTTATLTIRAVPDVDDCHEFVVDCPHGTTTVTLLNGKRGRLTQPECVQVALTRHDDEEGCGCTARLWRRYGEAS